ncbi:serum albumin-like [Spea bombifrons]|uniref:serum albumin-like n=1 Tax=Spea bombifrons TaxID=233779 RepID=UPI00234B4767|nr:serum albumin-like [Spea bombifrons]
MKWFILICLIIGSTESRNILKRDTEPSHRHIADIYNALGEKYFDAIVLVMLSQNLQKCPLEEHNKLVTKITDFAKHCVQEPKDEECLKPLATLFFDAICAVPDLNTHYDWSNECCGKEGEERSKCFREHRNIVHEPYKRPTSEELCVEFKKDPKHTLEHYIHEASRRYPNLYSPAIIGLTEQYKTILSDCCEAEEKDKCFTERMTEHKKVKHMIEAQQRHICHVLDHFPVRVLKAMKLAQISQKYPRASLEVVHKLVEEVTHLHQDCCHGDMLECMVERMELTQHTCEHHADISSKLETCCQKPIVERTTCIVNQENDDLPEGLPPHVTKFIEDPKVCEHFAKEKDGFLSSFLYEYARRHPEFSVELLLAIAHGYENLLEKCCKEDNPPECYKDAATLLSNAIKSNTDLLHQNCGAQEKLGDYFFQVELLGRYTRKMPNVTTSGLIELTKQMVEVGKKCCALDEKKKMPCADGGLSILIGQMCEKQEHTFINNNVRHCCSDLYSGRRACFTGLGVEPSYVPPPITDDAFHFDAALCTATPHDFEIKKLGLFIQLLKLKPHLESEKIKEVVAEFTKMLGKCCAEADHQACFTAEKPKLMEHCKQLIEH